MEEIVTVVEKYSGHPMINQALFSLQCFFQEFSMVYIQAWKISNDIYIYIYIFSMLMLTLMAIIHYFLALLAQIFPPILYHVGLHIYNLYFIYLFIYCCLASVQARVRGVS